jgi:hypothetical protein
MRRFFLIALAFISLNQFSPIEAQKLIKNSAVTGVCYGSNKVVKSYIPPPPEFFKKGKSKGGGSITVYYTGFSKQASAAIDYAVTILESVLPADTKFTIKASWEKITTTGVLAQSSITGYAAGWGINALNPMALYPVALAEKIAGVSLNDDLQGDITLAVNSSVNWYLGTDGQVPLQKYDLVTVALHEICHGLGFFDSFNTDGTIGSWGIGNLPIIYDSFVENFSGNRLIDTLKFLNNSTDLRSQFISNQIYFNGPLFKKYSTSVNSGILRAKLYAPSTWDAGSSISHLDENATLRENGLMTPFIGLQEAIHNPGKYTFSILGDLGWINTRIIHTPIGDTESHLTRIDLAVSIKSDTTYNHNKVGVVFSYDNFITSDSLFLTSPGLNDTYNTSIPVSSYNTGLKYYFFAQDAFNRLYRSPSLFGKLRYSVFIGTDTVKPVITHTPVSFYLQTVDSIKFDASVTDNLGLDSVYVEYKVNKGASKFVRLKNIKADEFKTVFNARSLDLKGHDSIQYKIFAVDTAIVPNLAILPKTGFFVTHIEEISSTLPGYSTDFSNAGPDFFNVGFSVSKPAGFNKSGLNSKHPYESPQDNSKTIEYTAMLRHPLKFNESGMLFNYSEVVLVEPGETGSVFGSSSFYDYVIVDGSKDFGKTWFNLIDGYDSRMFPTWLTDYNSSIVGDNSTFIATEDMLQKHSFLYRPSDNISAGDTMLVRFRLFSDPFANGWGWVIEDLKISPLVDAVSEVKQNTLKVYPNPGNGHIKISTEGLTGDIARPLHYSVFNPSGVCLLNKFTSGSTETLVDISGYPAGIYIIMIYLDDGIKTIKYSLIK